MTSFSESGLNENLLKAVEELGFVTPTEIQQQAIPFILTHKTDLIALAQTGTGKTAAFSLPVLQQIDVENRDIQLIVLCPTRELCLQITKDIGTYSTYMKGIKVQAVYGGSSIMDQIYGLKNNPQIVVGTPGRVIDLISRKKLKLESIQWVVLDEADEMLSMGFKDDLETILAETPSEKQTLLFSATMNREVERISKNYLNSPEKISIKGVNENKKNIVHEYYVIGSRQKKEGLRRLLDANPGFYCIIFCRTRIETQEVADFLMQHGYAADALHGDLSQAQRDTVMKKFRLKNINLLVATDVAARGLDVDSLTHVIHYSLPDDPEVFVHRSGRTGRAGKDGISMALVKPEEIRKLKMIKASTKIEITEKNIPEGKQIIAAQVDDFWKHILQDREDNFEFNPKQIPDLSDISKEELAAAFMQVHLRNIAAHYTAQPILPKPEPMKGRERGERDYDRRERSDSRDRGGKFGRDRERSSDRGSDRGRDRERGNSGERSGSYEKRERRPRNTNANMTRFFFNVGKKDGLNKTDILQIINKATSNGKSAPDIGNIEILDKFSFFEVDADYKREVLNEIPQQNFNGRPLRVEEAE